MYLYGLEIQLPKPTHEFIMQEIKGDIEVVNIKSKTSNIGFGFDADIINNEDVLNVYLISMTFDPSLLPLIGWIESFYNAKLIWSNREDETNE